MKCRKIILVNSFMLVVLTVFANNMVLVKGGVFEMGANQYFDDATHTVEVDSFYMSKYELTMEEFDLFFKDVKPNGVDDSKLWRPPLANLDLNYYYKVVRKQEIPANLPMIGITWLEAVKYCNWKSLQEGFEPAYIIDGETVSWIEESNGYRLPTEAEWEFAARGGNHSKGYSFSGSNNPDEVSWYKDNSEETIHPIGMKEPNELGLYDLSGNVAEWCWDYYDFSYYKNSICDNPKGPTIGKPPEDDTESSISARVFRGGTYWGSRNIGVFYRGYADPDSKNSIGLRVARNYARDPLTK